MIGGGSKMRIAIIGGGIGGLCTTYALLQKGIDVEVFEAAHSFKPIGAGIGIGSNAMQDLVDLGIGEEIYADGTILKTQEFYSGNGKLLNTIDFSALQKLYNQSNITIQRADLHRSLFQAIPAHLLHLNKKCIAVNQVDSNCQITFSDGNIVNFDYVIAADGIHSPIRQQLVPNSKPRFAGYMCWRGVAEITNQIEPNTSVEIWDTIGRFGYAPLKDGKVYWFACVNASEKDQFLHGLEKEQIAHLFKNFPKQVGEIIRATEQTTILHHDLYDLAPLKQFHFNRILLLGDAAHATTPNMGQGAGQAIEDALALSQMFDLHDSFEDAAAAYEQKRMPKTKKVTTLSRQIGWIAQWQNPVLAKARDLAFPFVPSSLLLKRLKFLFSK